MTQTKPCNEHCEKCGSKCIIKRFYVKGSKVGKAYCFNKQPELTIRQSDEYIAIEDHIRFNCSDCLYLWVGKPLKETIKKEVIESKQIHPKFKIGDIVSTYRDFQEKGAKYTPTYEVTRSEYSNKTKTHYVTLRKQLIFKEEELYLRNQGMAKKTTKETPYPKETYESLQTSSCVFCRQKLDNANPTGQQTYQFHGGGEVQFIFSYGSRKFDNDIDRTTFRGAVCDECGEQFTPRMTIRSICQTKVKQQLSKTEYDPPGGYQPQRPPNVVNTTPEDLTPPIDIEANSQSWL